MFSQFLYLLQGFLLLKDCLEEPTRVPDMLLSMIRDSLIGAERLQSTDGLPVSFYVASTSILLFDLFLSLRKMDGSICGHCFETI